MCGTYIYQCSGKGVCGGTVSSQQQYPCLQGAPQGLSRADKGKH